MAGSEWEGLETMTDEIKISLNLPQDLVRRLDRMADDEHRSRTGQIEHILLKYIEGDD